MAQTDIQANLQTKIPAQAAAAAPARATDTAIYAVIFATAVLLWWLARNQSTLLPAWAPWDFSFVEFLSGWLAVFWYVRGLARTPANALPSRARQVAFFAGVLIVYAVLETHYEYLAEHQFFFNRIQHVVMHHVGPFLLALSWPGDTLMRGMPAWARRVVTHPAITRPVYVLQQPALAAVLFSGSFFFWLIPPVHFRAMIDPDLFALMNWTMVADGILFWCLVLDPRPKPPARAGFGTRAALSMLVMFPQIIGGALISFSPRDLYPFYDLCGRIYPDLGADYDQVIGGLITWIPPAMMSVLALVLVLNVLRLSEERSIEDDPDEDDTRPIIDASQWTGG
ncbi:MAG: cytochrome c oxidase assembly protein [Pseudolabrys sp.]